MHAPERVDVRAIRKGLGLTQAAFAARFGLPKGTIEDWEQKRREPDTGSRILLKVIEREPDAVQRALAQAAGMNEHPGDDDTEIFMQELRAWGGRQRARTRVACPTAPGPTSLVGPATSDRVGH